MTSDRLAYTDEGRGDVIVLLHAFPVDGRMWAVQRRDLSRTHRVIAPDFAGFGGSATVSLRRSLDEHADDVARLLDALAIDRATIVGLSMGGYITFAFARRHPKRVARLVLADTKATPDTPEGRAARDQNIALVEKEGVREIGRSQRPDAVTAALAAMRDRPDSTPLLPQFDVPTAVIVGEDDSITPPSDAHAMADALPRAKLIVLPQAGHLANLEAPTEFTTAMADWLNVPSSC